MAHRAAVYGHARDSWKENQQKENCQKERRKRMQRKLAATNCDIGFSALSFRFEMAVYAVGNARKRLLHGTGSLPVVCGALSEHRSVKSVCLAARAWTESYRLRIMLNEHCIGTLSIRHGRPTSERAGHPPTDPCVNRYLLPEFLFLTWRLQAEKELRPFF